MSTVAVAVFVMPVKYFGLYVTVAFTVYVPAFVAENTPAEVTEPPLLGLLETVYVVDFISLYVALDDKDGVKLTLVHVVTDVLLAANFAVEVSW